MNQIKHKTFFEDVRLILRKARQQSYVSVNSIMVQAYWDVGKRIVEEEQGGKERAVYGKGLIEALSRELGEEFGKGFSVANLKNFRQFYQAFPDVEKSYALRSQLSWTHLRLIMRVKSDTARKYYLKDASEQNWSSRQLEREIKSMSYERLLKAPKSENEGLEVAPSKSRPENFIKDPYVLEFLGLQETGGELESELESAILGKLKNFLLELGKGFSFVGQQFRISSETKHFYVDLVFYNYLLKCFVLIDLKTGSLSHQDIGQMDMYVRMFDDLKRGEDDNPTLGLILCSDKDETVVKYSVLNDSQQLFASKYLRVLPSEDELRRALEERHILEVGIEE
nr:DUF1016 family protein [Desulfobulbaceae bacterium]